MNSSRIFAAIFTILAIASFTVNGVNGADSVAGWAMLVIANIHGAAYKIQSDNESLK